MKKYVLALVLALAPGPALAQTQFIAAYAPAQAAAPETTWLINYSPAAANGGLETAGSPFGSWTQDAAENVIDTSDAHGGSHAAKLQASVYFYQSGILSTGKSYTTTFWAKQYNASAVVVYIGSDASTTIGLSDSWTEYSYTAVSAGNTNFILHPNTGSQQFAIDDIRLFETP